MSDEFWVDRIAIMEDFVSYMDSIDGQYAAVTSYGRREVCSTEGFVGLMEVLVPALEAVGDAMWTFGSGVEERWDALRLALWKTGRDYDAQDDQITYYFRKTMEERIAQARRRQLEQRLEGMY